MVIENIKFNNISINVVSLTPIQVPGTIKQRVGKLLSRNQIINRIQQDWTINIRGELFGSNRDTDRDSIEALDDLTIFNFSDGGRHDGRYVMIPRSLRFGDNAKRPAHYIFNVTILEFNQEE